MDIRKNLSLILGLSIPVVILIVIAIAVVVPRFFAAPTYSFLYTTDQNRYYYTQRNYEWYRVEQGKLMEESRPITDPTNDDRYNRIPEKAPQLYLYDVLTKRSRELSFEDAAKLTLDINETSPDGYTISSGSRRGLMEEIVGGSSDYRKKFLVGHGVRQEITLINPTGSSYYDFRFFGWVIQ